MGSGSTTPRRGWRTPALIIPAAQRTARPLSRRREIVLLAPRAATLGSQREAGLKKDGTESAQRGDDGAVIAVRFHLSSHGRTNSATENLARAAHPALGV